MKGEAEFTLPLCCMSNGIQGRADLKKKRTGNDELVLTHQQTMERMEKEEGQGREGEEDPAVVEKEEGDVPEVIVGGDMFDNEATIRLLRSFIDKRPSKEKEGEGQDNERNTGEEESLDTFAFLPNEIMLYIFEALDTRHLLTSCCLVCRRWAFILCDSS